MDGVHLLGAEVTYQPPISRFVQFALSAQSPGAVQSFPSPAEGAPPTFAAKNSDEILLFPRVETFFDLTDNSHLALGLSGAIGENKRNSDDKTHLIGVDFLYRWKGGTQPGWPYIRWLTEAIWAIRENPLVVAGANKGLQLGNDVVGGFFSELGYRFTYRWQVTGRVDYVGIPKGNEDNQLRLTGALRYYLNPVMKLNFQYEHGAPSGQDKSYHAFFIKLNVGIGTVTPGVGKFLDPF